MDLVHKICMRWDYPFIKAAGYGLHGRDSIPREDSNLPLYSQVQFGSGAHPGSYHLSSFLGDKAAGTYTSPLISVYCMD
jgi:hypothetical protein